MVLIRKTDAAKLRRNRARLIKGRKIRFKKLKSGRVKIRKSLGR